MRLFVLTLVLTFFATNSTQSLPVDTIKNQSNQPIQPNLADQPNQLSSADQYDILRTNSSTSRSNTPSDDTSPSDNAVDDSKNELMVQAQNTLFTDPKPSSLFGGQSAFASSVSRELENGIPKYAAKNALTRGSNYWKSEQNLTDKDEVSFVVTFKLLKVVGGTDIEWVKPPITCN